LAESTEVHAKLVLDDAASEALKKVKEGFGRVGEKVHEVTSEIAGMAKQALAVAAGFQLSGAIDSLKELGHELINAASGAEQQQKALAGLIAMTDKTGMSFEETMSNAVELHDGLEQIGIAAGTSTDQVIGAFEMIAQRSSKSTEEVKMLTAEMTQAGRALPGGVETLAAAYRDLETGIVRPRNAIVQLIKQTGTAQGTMKEIAKGLTAELAAGHADKVFDLAQIAIGKMSDKMKAAPPSFKEVTQSLKDIRENLFEAMGTPILKTLVPQLDRLKSYFVDNREAIERFAITAGEKIGVWVNQAADKIQEGFRYLQTHADEIQKAIESGVMQAKSVVEFILAHKEEIAIAYGVKTAVPIVGGAIQAGKAVSGVLGAVGGLAGAGGGGAGLGAGGGALAGGALLGVTAAAAASWYLAYDQWTKLMKESDEEGMNSAARSEARQRALTIQIAATAKRDLVDVAARRGDVGPLVEAWNLAQEKGDEAMEKYIANLLDKSDKLQMAFLASTTIVRDSFGELITKVGHGFQQKILSVKFENLKVTKVPDNLIQDFRGSTFNVKQDFRDQDPDRIAVIFRNDIARNATNRIGARTGGGPFT